MRPAYLSLLFALGLPALAQATTTLQAMGNGFALDIPYLEYGSGSAKQAFAARLATIDLGNFSLSTASAIPLQTNTGTMPTVSSAAGGFRLSIPYLEFSGGGTTRAYKADLTSSDLSSFIVDFTSVAEVTPTGITAPPTNIAVTKVAVQTVGSLSFASSTQWRIAWTAPANSAVHHYKISAKETATNSYVTAETTQTGVTLANLKAGTAYAITVAACADANCAQPAAATAVDATTSEEYWQLQGNGNATTGLTKIVADGNARISATRFGTEAGANAERIHLYYGAMRQRGLSVAATAVTTSAAVPSSYLSFTSLAGTAGITGPESGSAGFVKTVATGQGVPLTVAMGSKVRVFFEAEGSDGKTRILYLDSQDSYVGRDFNNGAGTTCAAAADFQTGGGCIPTLAIGVEGDSGGGNLKIRNARQFKLGWPTLDDWRWNGAAGSFMVFTTDQISGCSTAGMNHGYAVWDGTQWAVQYEAGGCPKLFKSAQAMFPLHIGGVRYKAYYGDPAVSSGKITSSSMPFLGPKKLLYADGAISGAPTVVDFEDWEAQGSARNVNFLWPDGSQLDATAEGYIDDYHFLTPTGSLDLQVMYLAITAGTEPPFAAAAVLLNP